MRSDLHRETAVAQEHVDHIEHLIRTHDLARLNDIDENTRDLPEEFGYSFSAVYASGETLSSFNNREVCRNWTDFAREFTPYIDELFQSAGGGEATGCS